MPHLKALLALISLAYVSEEDDSCPILTTGCACIGKSIDFVKSMRQSQTNLSAVLSSAVCELGQLPGLTFMNYKMRKLLPKDMMRMKLE